MSFLETMVALRRERILAEYGGLDPAARESFAAAAGPPRDFAAALCDRRDVAVIAEVKKASPSAGPIAPDCDAATVALRYQAGGAAAISVLTEPDRFAGSFADLSDVAAAVDVAVLCKDFVVDPVQLFIARGHGADAILLIVRVLGDLIPNYADLATTLGLTPVVEVAKKHGISDQTIYLWRQRYGTLQADEVKRLRVLEQENARLKKMVAERDLAIEVMKEIAAKKW